MSGSSTTHGSSDSAAMGWPQWRLVLLLAAICFLGHFNRIGMAVAADTRIMAQYGFSTTTIGNVYSAFLIAYTLAMIPAGWLIDRRGPRFALGMVCLGSALFIALTGSVGAVSRPTMALVAFLAIRALMGVLSAPLHPASATAVAVGVPFARRSGANGLITGAALLGIASTYVVFGAAIDRFGWPGAFLVAAAVTAALGAVWMAFGPPPREQSNETHRGATDAASQSPPNDVVGVGNLVLLTLSYGAVGYFQYLFFYWMHYYFESVLELGEEQSRFYASIPPLAMAVAMPLGGWLSDRIQAGFGWRAGRAGLVFLSMAGSAALLWVGIRAVEPVAIVTWMSLALGMLGVAEGPFWVTAVEVGGRRGGLSAAIFNTGGNAGGILAPILTPWISDSLGYGWQSGLSLGSLVCLLGAVCWIWIGPRKAHHA